MERLLTLMKKLLYPPVWLTLLLAAVSAAALTAVFLFQWNQEGAVYFSLFTYLSYSLSFYALIIFLLRLPELLKRGKTGLLHIGIIQRVVGHPAVRRYRNDLAFRGTVSLCQGLGINLVYAGFKLVTSWLYTSLWFGAIAVYYILLSLIRGVLIGRVRGTKRFTAEKEHLLHEYQGCRLCGCMMFVLNLGMLGMVIQMIVNNQSYTYPGTIIYASAAYTFYTLGLSIVNLIRFRRLHSPILSASKTITFTGALMSVLALQTAMISRFGKDQPYFRLMMNTITGAAVCLITFCAAIIMIVRANREISRLTGTQTDSGN